MSKLDEILEFGQWSEEKQKQQIKDLMLELIGGTDYAAPVLKEYIEKLRKKVEEL